MPFEPIKMQRRIFKTDDAKRPYVIELSPQPSKEWAEKFGLYTFPHLLADNNFPTIVEWGVAIPELPRIRAEEILESLAHAVEEVNREEASRIEQLPPDTRTIYQDWFDAKDQ